MHQYRNLEQRNLALPPKYGEFRKSHTYAQIPLKQDTIKIVEESESQVNSTDLKVPEI